MFRLDYPGVGPEHSFLKDMGRAEYHSVTDEEALNGMSFLMFLRYGTYHCPFASYSVLTRRQE